MVYFGGSAHAVTTQNVINSLFSASLLTPDTTRDSPTDTWDNVKIPASMYVSNLEPSIWYTVGTDTEPTNYSSLVGVPMWGVSKDGTANFSITWPIFDTECQWDRPGYTQLEWCQFSSNHSDSSTSCQNTTQKCVVNETTGMFVSGPYNIGPSVLTSNFTSYGPTYWEQSQLNSSSAAHYVDILYSIHDNPTYDNILYAGSKQRCQLRTTRVDAEIFCTNGACRVSRFRKSNDSKPDFINPVSL